MAPIQVNANGILFTLESIETNRAHRCPPDCGYVENSCSFKRALCFQPNVQGLIATQAILTVQNGSTANWGFRVGQWEIVDSHAYSLEAQDWCLCLRPPRCVESHHVVTPGTRGRLNIAFPELERGRDVARLNYLAGGTIYAFEVGQLKAEVAESFALLERTRLLGGTNDSYELKQIGGDINLLEAAAHSRVNNILVPREAIALENRIADLVFRIQQKARELSEPHRNLLADRVGKIMRDYEVQVAHVKEKEAQHRRMDEKVEHLYALSPREFEEYVAELLTGLGYAKVTLTPLSNDKGVDILALYGKRGWQCNAKNIKGWWDLPRSRLSWEQCSMRRYSEGSLSPRGPSALKRRDSRQGTRWS